MKTENYTTLEQAERLVCNGIDPNTADMCYQTMISKNVKYSEPFKPYMIPYSVEVESKEKLEKEYEAIKSDENAHGIVNAANLWEIKPCWSISALIDLIPYCCVKNDPICERYYVSCGSQETDSDALVGALIEMICVLKERKIL